MEKKGFLCLSCEFKGDEFIARAADLGHRVYLITSEAHKDDPWSYDKISETFYMPEKDGRKWDVEILRDGIAHLMRKVKIDRIIALDDYDVQKVAFLREEFRMPGMGQTTARHFFDKLAMRMKASEAGLPVPGFSSLFNDDDIRHFLANSRGPWFVKPRSDAGAIGIRKVEKADDFWPLSDELAENRYRYLIEEYTPGDVYHVDSLSFNGECLFTRSSMYLTPPFNVAHGGGIFRSCTLDVNDEMAKRLQKLNSDVLDAFGMLHGASHSEFIVSEGKIYFLETSARVGGANLSVMVDHATGVNLWTEWANIEHAVLTNSSYSAPDAATDSAGIIASLSRHEWTDYAPYTEPEIVWRLNKKHHIGFIFKHGDRTQVIQMLDKYAGIIVEEYHAAVPMHD